MADEPSRQDQLSKFRRKEWLTREECAHFLTLLGLRISKNHLSNLAGNNNAKKGPPYYRTRWTKVSYKADEVEAWAKSQTERIA